MAKTKILVIRISEEQAKALREKTYSAGFKKISEYVRCQLFRKVINNG